MPDHYPHLLHSAPIVAPESKVCISANEASFFTSKALPQEPGVSSPSPSEVERHLRYYGLNRTRASQHAWLTQRVIRALKRRRFDIDDMRSVTANADGNRPPQWHGMPRCRLAMPRLTKFLNPPRS
jgi:hypothetical protein